MNVRDRYLAVLRGEAVDRVPLLLKEFSAPAQSELDTIEDPLARELAVRVWEHTPAIVNWDSYVNRILVTPPRYMRVVKQEQRSDGVYTTTEIHTPKGTLTSVEAIKTGVFTSWHVKYPVTSRKDLDAIRSVPWEVPEEVRPVRKEELPWEFEEHNIMQTGVSSPMVCVADMMPFEMFLELCMTDLPLIEELTEICAERIADVMDVLFDGDEVDHLWMGGSEWLTPPMGSPRLYDALVFQQESRIIERAHRSGALCQVHCHGNVSGVLERIIESGADFLEPVEPPPDGDITFAEAKRRAAGRIALGGNIEARVLEHGEPADVEAATRAAFEGGGRGMVLKTTAGPLTRLTERMSRNYHRMVDIWEELSEEAL